MTLKISKTNLNKAWKLYNYLITWEEEIFGSKSFNNSACIFILTLVALYDRLTQAELREKSGVSYADIYRNVESLEKHYNYIVNNNGTYEISPDLLRTLENEDIKLNEVNENIFCTVLNNMRYHTQIFEKNLTLEKDNDKFHMMRALLNPVISNPIHNTDCRKLSLLGYMKYKPQKKQLSLNEFAYKKDWVGTRVI